MFSCWAAFKERRLPQLPAPCPNSTEENDVFEQPPPSFPSVLPCSLYFHVHSILFFSCGDNSIHTFLYLPYIFPISLKSFEDKRVIFVVVLQFYSFLWILCFFRGQFFMIIFHFLFHVIKFLKQRLTKSKIHQPTGFPLGWQNEEVRAGFIYGPSKWQNVKGFTPGW